MKEFKTNISGQIIIVKHFWNYDELTVDGNLQDRLDGMPVVSRSRMTGRLKDGRKIKISLGGNLKTHCNIFIDDELIFQE